MRTSTQLVIAAALLASLCATLAVAALPPTQAAIERCARIGLSSGCSGCESVGTGCEWCRKPGDDTFLTSGEGASNCAPKGFCDAIPQPVGRSWQYQSGGDLCQGDPTKVLKYLQVDPSNNNNNGQKLKDQELRNGFFDAKYCDFQSEPWAVDRFSKVFGDAIGGCRTVNNLLSVGTRQQLAACAGSNITSLSLKDEACIDYYQSLACTSRCWKYGEAVSFKHLCSNYCEKLNQHCRPALLSCLQGNSPLLNFDCRPKGDKDCYHPDLIPASGRFQSALCINVDPMRCKEEKVDCELEYMTDYPDGIVEEAWAYAEDTFSGATPPEPANPCCDYYGGWSVTRHIWRVTNAGSPGGLSCEDQLHNKLIAKKAELEATGFAVNEVMESADAGTYTGCYDQDDDGAADYCLGSLSMNDASDRCNLSGYAPCPFYHYPSACCFGWTGGLGK